MGQHASSDDSVHIVLFLVARGPPITADCALWRDMAADHRSAKRREICRLYAAIV